MASNRITIEALSMPPGSFTWQPIFARYIRAHQQDYFAKKKSYKEGEESFSLENALVRREDGQNVFCVIGSGFVGSNEMTAVRPIVGELTFHPDDTYSYKETAEEVIRITNRSRFALKKKFTSGEIKYHVDSAYSKARLFPQVCAKKPIYRESQHNKEGETYLKGMMIMKRMPGVNLHEAARNSLFGGLTFKQMMRLVVIPLLEAYQSQILVHGCIHGDIKTTNIMVEKVMGPNGPYFNFNFIDFEGSGEIGKKHHYKGTHGYIPLERHREFIFDPHDNPSIYPLTEYAQTNADLFALGIVIVTVFNYRFEPHMLFRLHGDIDLHGYDLDRAFHQLLRKMGGWYNPCWLKQHNYFRYLNDPASITPLEKASFFELIKSMTAQNSCNRANDIDKLIAHGQRLVELPEAGANPTPHPTAS